MIDASAPEEPANLEQTPMMAQYRRLRQQYPDAVLFYRLGDFYEMFERDAREVSALLNLTLTARNGVPMCGIPYHASRGYIGRLLNLGKKVAICEQLALPKGGKGLADRDVVEVITPGTAVDLDYLDSSVSNYLVSFARTGDWLSLSYVDLSTAEFLATEFLWAERADRLRKELTRLAPREALVPESLVHSDPIVGAILTEHREMTLNRFPDWSFDARNGRETLVRHFGTASLKGFGIPDDSPCVASAGPILEYVSETSRSMLPHLRSLRHYVDADFLGLDDSTQRNLEILRNLQDGGSRFTLVEVLDHTKTAMGSRRLKDWLLRPLATIPAIAHRHACVELLYRDQPLLQEVRDTLAGVLDLERLASRVAMDRAHGKDLLAIRQSIGAAEQAASLVAAKGALFETDAMGWERLRHLAALLERAVDEEASILLTEGGLIRRGFDAGLDQLRSVREDSERVLDGYLEEVRRDSGIGNLKLRSNRIIGHFFEVSKATREPIPSYFVRRQSVVGGERYTTERLIEIESAIASAGEQIVELERQLFLEVRETVKAEVQSLLDVAGNVAALDVYQSFAQAATIHGYVRPTVDESNLLMIVEGRHPVVEANLPVGDFVPNSCALDGEGSCFALITGPNMAGKSTYLRQVALSVLMAQSGSFVPAREATIGVVDRIFCRIGASDNLARGESTFLVEMTETANILRNAGKRSLVIMDEIGRGTGTNDGLAIAHAVCDYLLDHVRAKTLFATHFHELTTLRNDRLRNFSMEVIERNGDIVFLKRLREGPSANSYGIHVARLAGIPERVVERASEILLALTSTPASEPTADGRDRSVTSDPEGQRPLFPPEELIAQELVGLAIEKVTPLQALNLLAKWKAELGSRFRDEESRGAHDNFVI